MTTLVECGDCGREVSVRASACPGCGGPAGSEASGGTAKVAKGLKVLFAAGFWMMSMGLPVFIVDRARSGLGDDTGEAGVVLMVLGGGIVALTLVLGLMRSKQTWV